MNNVAVAAPLYNFYILYNFYSFYSFYLPAPAPIILNS